MQVLEVCLPLQHPIILFLFYFRGVPPSPLGSVGISSIGDFEGAARSGCYRQVPSPSDEQLRATSSSAWSFPPWLSGRSPPPLSGETHKSCVIVSTTNPNSSLDSAASSFSSRYLSLFGISFRLRVLISAMMWCSTASGHLCRPPPCSSLRRYRLVTSVAPSREKAMQ